MPHASGLGLLKTLAPYSVTCRCSPKLELKRLREVAFAGRPRITGVPTAHPLPGVIRVPQVRLSKAPGLDHRDRKPVAYGTLATIEETPRDFLVVGLAHSMGSDHASSRCTDEILKSQVSFRSDKDGIEVKVTETMEVEVDVTVAPLDGRHLGPPGPRYRVLFSDDPVLEGIDNQGAGERPSTVPAKPACPERSRALWLRPRTLVPSQCPCRPLAPAGTMGPRASR
jgi:hypothetical protein